MLDARSVGEAADDLSRVVDADGLSPAGTGNVDVLKDATGVGEAVHSPGHVAVYADDRTRTVDPRSEAVVELGTVNIG